MDFLYNVSPNIPMSRKNYQYWTEMTITAELELIIFFAFSADSALSKYHGYYFNYFFISGDNGVFNESTFSPLKNLIIPSTMIQVTIKTIAALIV